MGNFIPIDKDAAFKPRIVSSNPAHERQEIAESVLPKGANTVPRPRRTASGGYFGGNAPMGTSPMGGGGGGSASYHMQRPYFPGTESPDRVQYPKTRQEANKAWRLFHESDPIFGTAVDMYAEMLVSDFDIIVGDEKSREVRDTLEYMCQETNLQEKLRYIIKEYLVMGEAIPHNFYDDSLGIWTYIAMHNPDYIDVVDAPIVNMDPILNFIPDDALRDLMMDNSPEARDLKDHLPAEFVTKIMARQKIRLSPLNATFIARKLHPYQIRGTSMASRMWRIFMVEDAVYNSTIATFRRHAAPVKVVKLGDAASGWLPAPGAETKVLQMLNRVETDPQAWLVYNYGINFEAWGTTDKAISISKEHDVIEKVKLLALGLSKSFMTGEVTYACFINTVKLQLGDNSYDDIQNIKVGDSVIDRFGMPQIVEESHKYPSPDKMVKITTYGDRELTLTDNHALPIFTRPRTCLCGCGEDLGDTKIVSQGRMKWKSFLPHHNKRHFRAGRDREWLDYKMNERVVASFPKDHEPYQRLEASEVRKGDWMMISRKFDKSEVEATECNWHKARLLGYYVAEGSRGHAFATGEFSIKFSFGRTDSGKEVQYVTDVVDTITTLFPEDDRLSNVTYSNKGTIEVPCICQAISLNKPAAGLSEWLLDNGGEYSHQKKLSTEVMRWNLELKKELIKGMYRGDGYLFKEGNRLDVVYTTTSKQLMHQLEVILAQLGYACYVHAADPRIDKKGYKHKERYFITCAGKQAKTLAELVWSDVPSVWGKIDWTGFEKEGDQGCRCEVFKDDDYLYLPIKSVEVVDVDKEKHPHVYSLTVANTNSYTLDNLASFNSAKSGLQVFLRRLLSLRQFLENVWLYPKFFRPISEINQWVTASPSEVNHKYRIKRTAQEIQEQNLVMMPTLKWKNKLDPSVDQDLLTAYGLLEKLGVKLSKATISSAVGVDWQDELEGSLKEFKSESEMKDKVLGDNLKQKYDAAHGQAQQQPAQPPGSPGSGQKPPGAPGSKPGGAPGGMDDASKPPGSAPAPGGSGDLGGIEAPSGGGMPQGVV